MQADEPSKSSGRVVSRTQHVVKGDAQPQPLEVDVRAKRLGGSLHLDITGIGRGRLEGESFEDPTAWQVEVVQSGMLLKRTVNGPVSVAREPVGRATGNRWDVVVRFSVNFMIETESLPLEVRVHPPDERASKIRIDAFDE